MPTRVTTQTLNMRVQTSVMPTQGMTQFRGDWTTIDETVGGVQHNINEGFTKMAAGSADSLDKMKSGFMSTSTSAGEMSANVNKSYTSMAATSKGATDDMNVHMDKMAAGTQKSTKKAMGAHEQHGKKMGWLASAVSQAVGSINAEMGAMVDQAMRTAHEYDSALGKMGAANDRLAANTRANMAASEAAQAGAGAAGAENAAAGGGFFNRAGRGVRATGRGINAGMRSKAVQGTATAGLMGVGAFLGAGLYGARQAVGLENVERQTTAQFRISQQNMTQYDNWVLGHSAQLLQKSTDMVTALGQASRLQLGPQATEQIVTGAAKMSAVFGTDLTTSTESAMGMMKMFHANAKDIPGFLDTMTAAMVHSHAGMQLFGTTANKIAFTMAQAHVPFRQFADIMATIMHNAPGLGNRAIAPLTQVIGLLQNASPSAVKAAGGWENWHKMVNLHTYGVQGSLRNVMETINKLNATGTEKGHAAALTLQQAVLGTGLRQDIVRMIATDRGGLGRTRGVLDTGFGTVSQTTTNQFKMMQLASESMAITFGRVFIPMMRQLMATFMPLLTTIGNFMRQHKGMMDAILKGALIFGAAMLAIKAWNVVMTFGSGITKVFGYAVETLAGKTKLATAAQWLMTTAQDALNLAMDANPLFLIIGALVLLGVGLFVLYQKWTPFRNFVNAAFADLKKFAGWLQEVFVRAWHLVTNALSTALNWIKGNWKTVVPLLFGPFGLVYLAWQKWGGQITKFFLNLWNTVIGQIENFGTMLWNTMTGAWTAITNWLGSNWKTLLIGLVSGIFLGPGSALATLVWTLLPGSFRSAATNAVGGFLAGIKNEIKAIITMGANIGGSIITGVKNAFSGAGGAFTHWLTTWVKSHMPHIDFGPLHIGGGGASIPVGAYSTMGSSTPGTPYRGGYSTPSGYTGAPGATVFGMAPTSISVGPASLAAAVIPGTGQAGSYGTQDGNAAYIPNAVGHTDIHEPAGTVFKLPGNKNSKWQLVGQGGKPGILWGLSQIWRGAKGGLIEFLHMRRMNLGNPGAWYSGGTVLGLSGGVPGVDTDSAHSSGAHLHVGYDARGHSDMMAATGGQGFTNMALSGPYGSMSDYGGGGATTGGAYGGGGMTAHTSRGFNAGAAAAGVVSGGTAGKKAATSHAGDPNYMQVGTTAKGKPKYTHSDYYYQHTGTHAGAAGYSFQAGAWESGKWHHGRWVHGAGPPKAAGTGYADVTGEGLPKPLRDAMPTIIRAANKYHIDPMILVEMALTESSGFTNLGSGGGSFGWMNFGWPGFFQGITGWGDDGKGGFNKSAYAGQANQIYGAAWYISALMAGKAPGEGARGAAFTRGNLTNTLMAYNAGVSGALGGGGVGYPVRLRRQGQTHKLQDKTVAAKKQQSAAAAAQQKALTTGERAAKKAADHWNTWIKGFGNRPDLMSLHAKDQWLGASYARNEKLREEADDKAWADYHAGRINWHELQAQLGKNRATLNTANQQDRWQINHQMQKGGFDTFTGGWQGSSGSVRAMHFMGHVQGAVEGAPRYQPVQAIDYLHHAHTQAANRAKGRAALNMRRHPSDRALGLTPLPTPRAPTHRPGHLPPPLHHMLAHPGAVTDPHTAGIEAHAGSAVGILADIRTELQTLNRNSTRPSTSPATHRQTSTMNRNRGVPFRPTPT